MTIPPWPGCISCSKKDDIDWLEENMFPNFSWSSQAQGFFYKKTKENQTWNTSENIMKKEKVESLAKSKLIFQKLLFHTLSHKNFHLLL